MAKQISHKIRCTKIYDKNILYVGPKHNSNNKIKPQRHFTLFPWPPLLVEQMLCLDWAVSRKLSLALKLLETATFVHVSLAESTLELPNIRPHLLAPVPRADCGADTADGDGHGDGTGLTVRVSSVSVNLAGSFHLNDTFHRNYKQKDEQTKKKQVDCITETNKEKKQQYIIYYAFISKQFIWNLVAKCSRR